MLVSSCLWFPSQGIKRPRRGFSFSWKTLCMEISNIACFSFLLLHKTLNIPVRVSWICFMFMITPNVKKIQSFWKTFLFLCYKVYCMQKVISYGEDIFFPTPFVLYSFYYFPIKLYYYQSNEQYMTSHNNEEMRYIGCFEEMLINNSRRMISNLNKFYFMWSPETYTFSSNTYKVFVYLFSYNENANSIFKQAPKCMVINTFKSV